MIWVRAYFSWTIPEEIAEPRLRGASVNVQKVARGGATEYVVFDGGETIYRYAEAVAKQWLTCYRTPEGKPVSLKGQDLLDMVKKFEAADRRSRKTTASP